MSLSKNSKNMTQQKEHHKWRWCNSNVSLLGHSLVSRNTRGMTSRVHPNISASVRGLCPNSLSYC
eukprot:jgi/Antlo1/463/2108